MEARHVAAVALGLLALVWSAASVGPPGDADRLAPPAELDGPTALLWGTPLDLHRASAADLEVLPGVGPARARAIVQTRCRRPFESVSDLERVPGIGPRTVERLAGWVRVDDPVPHGCEGDAEAPVVDPPAAGGIAGAASRQEGA